MMYFIIKAISYVSVYTFDWHCYNYGSTCSWLNQIPQQNYSHQLFLLNPNILEVFVEIQLKHEPQPQHEHHMAV